MDRVLKAIRFASEAHKDQRRKIDQSPYIAHPLAVGLVLCEMGQAEDVVIAGFLHDTLEDTATSEDDLRREFGSEVLELVKSASEDKALGWLDRKKSSIEKAKALPLGAKLVIAADKYHNLFSIREDQKVWGEKLWGFFNRGKDDQRWYYVEMSDALKWGVKYEEIPLFEKIDDLIRAVF